MSPFDVVTVCLIAAVPVVWIAWDVVLGLKRQKTESMWLAEWSRCWNVLPFLAGTLCGHWFMQNPHPNYALWPVALALTLAVLAYDLLCRPWSVKGASVTLLEPVKWLRYPGLWLALGIPVGFFFFPQRLP